MQFTLPTQVLCKHIQKHFCCFLAVFLLLGGQVYAQITVRGTVNSAADGSALPGVNVSIKGTNTGTVTNIDGQYSLDVPGSESILIFSFIGMVTQEVTVGNQTQIIIQMAEDAENLDEIVITALGVEREKKALGYSVQEIQGEELTKAKDPNLLNNLSGKIAGVQVVGGNSGVGSTAWITIRGQSSLIPGASQPLFVVDGIPINNQTNVTRSEGNLEVDYGNGAGEINPDDIENISVLKGPTAAALYGSRGQNGVILITTKSGNNKQGIGVSVNSTTTFETLLTLPKYQNEYGQGAGFEFEFGDGFGAGINDNIDESWGPRLDGRLIRQHDSPTANGFRGGDSHPSIDRGEITPTPWVSNPDNIRDFFETGVTFNNSVALTGANQNGNFRLGFTNLKNEGIVPNTNLERNTFALNASYKLTEKLRASASVNYIRSTGTRPNNSYGTENIMYLWVWFGRQIDMNSLRDYWQPGLEGTQQFNYNYNWHDNPFFTVFENTNDLEKDRLIGNLKLDYQITPSLSLMLRSGVDYFSELRVGKRAFSSQRYARGQYREDNIYYREVNTDFLLTYNKQVSDDFQLTASVGGNRRDLRQRYRRIGANELNVAGLYSFENSRIPLTRTQEDSPKRVNSLYAFANIAFREFLYLDLTVRNDWSSALTNPQDPDNSTNSYFYPSASLSAIVSDIVNLPEWISFAKVRGSWAQVGNDTDPFNLLTTYNLLEPRFGNSRASFSSELKNANLKPERTTSYEVGVDLRFFNGRLGIDAAYYVSDTRNQLLSIPVSITSGFGGTFTNAGKIRNQGVELSLNATPVQLENGFSWNINVNYTRNRGKVLELIDGLDTYTISSNYVTVLAKVGERMGDVYGTGFVTVDDPNSQFFGQVVHNADGFSQRDPELKRLGNYNPDFMVGLLNSFSYKGLNLSILFDWRQGGVVNSRTVLIGGTSGMMDFTVPGREEGIISPGVIDNGDGTFRQNDVRLSGRDFYWWTYNRGNEEVGMFDASFLKLREVSLSYTIPNRIWGNTPIRNVTISAIGRNLALWTENPHFDPETLSWQGGTIVPGVEDMAMPSTRSFGFKIGFEL